MFKNAQSPLDSMAGMHIIVPRCQEQNESRCQQGSAKKERNEFWEYSWQKTANAYNSSSPQKTERQKIKLSDKEKNEFGNWSENRLDEKDQAAYNKTPVSKNDFALGQIDYKIESVPPETDTINLGEPMLRNRRHRYICLSENLDRPTWRGCIARSVARTLTTEKW